MQRPWFVPLLAAYPLLYIAVTNPGQANAGVVAITVVSAVLAASLILLLLRYPMGGWPRAGLGTTWLLLLFYSYGPMNQWWVEWGIARMEQGWTALGGLAGSSQVLLSSLWVLILVLGLAALRWIDDPVTRRCAGLLNVTAILLLALVTGSWVAGPASGGRPESEPPALRTGFAGIRPAEPRDVYVIVLDGYARSDVLKDFYDFDNQPFLAELKSRGFQVDDHSTSNYAWTFLSLASMLNFDYLQSLLGSELDPDSSDRSRVYQLLRDNQAAAMLRQYGYRSVHLQSTWGGTGRNPAADEFVPCHTGLFQDDYLRAVAEASWLRAFGSRMAMDLASCHLANFESLAAQAARPGPKFVFAHFTPPHHPYLFDREGRILRRATLSDQFDFQAKLWESREPYVDQLVFMNRRILAVIDRLIADSGRTPIIMLLSDHGPNLRNGLQADEQRRVRFGNLSALLLPESPPGLIPAGATPVNHFRRILNQYFSAGVPLLPDRHYWSTYHSPFSFVETGPDGGLVPVAPR